MPKKADGRKATHPCHGMDYRGNDNNANKLKNSPIIVLLRIIATIIQNNAELTEQQIYACVQNKTIRYL